MTHLAVLGNAGSHHFPKWLASIARQGVKVTLLSFTEAGRPLEGVEVRRLQPPFSRTGTFADFWGPTEPLRSLLNDLEVDVLMASYATSYGLLGVRCGFRPLIVQTWTADVTVHTEGWKGWYYRPIVRYVLGRADLITTDGPALAAVVRKRYPGVHGRLVSTLWGIDLEAFRMEPGLREQARAAWEIPADAPVVTNVRGVFYWYRPDVVLPALMDVLETRADVYVLALTLSQKRTPGVQALLDALKNHPRARVADRFLSQDEMRGVWAMTDAFISIPPFDGISESLLEGMYAGAIPIVSAIDSNRVVLERGEGAVFVDGATKEDLLRALHATLDRLDELKAAYAPRNRAWVEQHANVDATARQVAGLVRGLSQAKRTA